MMMRKRREVNDLIKIGDFIKSVGADFSQDTGIQHYFIAKNIHIHIVYFVTGLDYHHSVKHLLGSCDRH